MWEVKKVPRFQALEIHCLLGLKKKKKKINLVHIGNNLERCEWQEGIKWLLTIRGRNAAVSIEAFKEKAFYFSRELKV